MTAATARAAKASEADAIVALLTEAFQDDPVSRWVFPDDQQRLDRANPAFFTTLVGAALEIGRVDVTDDLTAATLWFPGGGNEDTSDIDGFVGLEPAEQERLDALFARMQEHAPRREHFWHGQFAGVRPDLQRHGIGEMLTRHALLHFDADNVPSYLEASSAESANLCRRMGYREFGSPFTVPGGGPSMRPMWREING